MLLPEVEDIFSRLGKAKYFTTLDLRSHYHNIALEDDSIKKTAFVTPFCKFEYFHVPFGTKNTPFHVQSFLNKVLNR